MSELDNQHTATEPVEPESTGESSQLDSNSVSSSSELMSNDHPDAFESFSQTEKLAVLESLLFAADEPLNEKVIVTTAQKILEAELPSLIEKLEAKYRSGHHALTIQKVGGGYRLATMPEYAETIRRLYRGKLKTKLSRAALETLSIIAYRQPVNRAQIDAIRGVESVPVLKNLIERELIEIRGREETPGRPLLYGTTKRFLEYFGLDSLDSLPKHEELFELRNETGTELEKEDSDQAETDSTSTTDIEA